jgi:hypothetical protein
VSGRWRRAPAAMLAVLTGLNGLNYLDRYVGAATLPLMLASADPHGRGRRAAAVGVHPHLRARVPGDRLARRSRHLA